MNNILLKYNYKTYEDCRKTFIEIASKKGGEPSNISVPNKQNDSLSIDFAFFPSKNRKNEKLVIISSGIHGIEGYVGSAIQFMILEELLEEIKSKNDKLALLFIHSLNPWGQKHYRRCTENNIDLNRNFPTSSKMFDFENKGYSSAHKFLNPKKAFSLYRGKSFLFFLNTVLHIIIKGIGPFRQSILQGQYQYPQGIFFGGSNKESTDSKESTESKEPTEQQVEPLIQKLTEYIDGSESVLCLDLHTGYGITAELQIFIMTSYIKDKYPEIFKNIEIIFEDYKIVGGNASTEDTKFYEVYGSFTEKVFQICGNIPCFPVGIEFGTYNSHKTMGQIRSLKVIIEENQAYHFGYKNDEHDEHKKYIRKKIESLFYPEDQTWHEKVMDSSRKGIPKFIERFYEINQKKK